MSEELKPCPFCGGKVDPTGWLTGYGETGPECEECGATAPTLEIWNNRPRVAELEAELADAVSLFKLVMDEHPGKERNGNAPGHCHEIPGIWDSDNGAKAGKPCAWCAVWNNAHKFLARHGDKS